MATYRIDFSRDSEKELAKIAKGDAKRASMIADAVDALATDPRPNGCTQLAPGRYRIRKGGYRIIYAVNDGKLTVLILVIDRRGEAYNTKNMRATRR